MRHIGKRAAISTSSCAPFGLDLSMAVFDRATRLARSMFAQAGASIILVHKGEVWRSRYADILPAEDPVTEAVLEGGELFWIEDGTRDPRFADNPLVTGPPFLRFTVAVPIRLEDGSTPGVLSISGLEPQPFDLMKAARLQDIADFVADEWVRAHAVAALAQSLRDRDIALERSERSEQRLRLALSLADVHIWELDCKELASTERNGAPAPMAEQATYESAYKAIDLLVDPRDRTAVENAWKDHVENGSDFRPEHRIKRGDGSETWVQSALKVQTDESGNPARMIAAIRDVTAQKRAEFALREAKEAADAANNAKSAFLASMSHELRTPLNAILGFAEIIKEEIMGAAPDQYVGYAGDIHASGRHLLDLVNDILDISKIEAGKVELHEADIDPRALLEDVITSFGKQAAAADVAIQSEFEYLPLLRADKRLLKQVLLNLVSNALKFTPRGGSISVAAKCVPSIGLQIAVSDTGIGMSASEIEIALTPFGQIDSKLARSFKGTGLGLPISRSLLGLHGGELTVTSAPGEGTCVTITLPERRVLSDVACLAAC